MDVEATSQTQHDASQYVYKETMFFSLRKEYSYIIHYMAPKVKLISISKAQRAATCLQAFLTKTLLYIRAQDSKLNQGKELLKGHKVRETKEKSN